MSKQKNMPLRLSRKWRSSRFLVKRLLSSWLQAWRSPSHDPQVGKAAQRIGPGIFLGEIMTGEAKREKELTQLHAKIEQLAVERDFLAEA